ncbi:protein ovarian tumor locus [Drosophila subobscura]|uniref:protein ovarian tumor locus n=1 Tax=Drosophila subobscura TaxID=7241 RepID=UPI00155A1F78|nr:protein ovarian tumor locus [Drosophila subobscura]
MPHLQLICPKCALLLEISFVSFSVCGFGAGSVVESSCGVFLLSFQIIRANFMCSAAKLTGQYYRLRQEVLVSLNSCTNPAMASNFRTRRGPGKTVERTDPIDEYLAKQNLYRKIMIKGGRSSLFRMVAEQMYDTQNLHYEVRMDCVRFMMDKRRLFRRNIKTNFNDYLLKLEKPNTEGTMIELRALCLMYGRNAILYEPMKLGTPVIFSDNYKDNFSVFFDKYGHFDAVYSMKSIEEAAVCQAITYKMLYQMCFKLPDVSIAVEKMLNPDTFNKSTTLKLSRNGTVLRLFGRNGRNFDLSSPELTKCLLNEKHLCDFHNRERWQEYVNKFDRMPLSCTLKNMDECIAPFTYSVAKSLSADVYRNVELSSYIMMKNEAIQFKLYAGDYDFCVGAHCQVELDKRPGHMKKCYIKKIDWKSHKFSIRLEGTGTELWVPSNTVHPLQPSEFHAWKLGYFQRMELQRFNIILSDTNTRKFETILSASLEQNNHRLAGNHVPQLQSQNFGLDPPVPQQGYIVYLTGPPPHFEPPAMSPEHRYLLPSPPSPPLIIMQPVTIYSYYCPTGCPREMNQYPSWSEARPPLVIEEITDTANLSAGRT